MSILHDTADAVMELLATGTFSKTIDPQVSYDTELLLENAGTLRVDVVAAALTAVADSRISLRYEAGIDIAVRYRFGLSEQETTGAVDVKEVGAFLQLLEEIGEHLATPANRHLPLKVMATWISNEIRFPWVPDHLRQQRQYTGILRATYAVAKGF
jgi:hypothetical protein